MHVIIIPAYKPSHKLITLIKELINLSQEKILLIDDGSGNDYSSIFLEAKSLGCDLLTHQENLGKGAAIKTGIKYAHETIQNIEGYLTCDADGQHLPKDIIHILNTSKNHPNELILGVRSFKNNSVPFRNRLGNSFSSFYFKLYTGKKCPDTQTGLRLIPSSMTDDALSIKENRYDYEMSFLLKQSKKGNKMVFIPIETVYDEKNADSHFRPFKDSILIYKQPIKFTLASLSSAAIDLSIFTLLIYFLSNSIIEKVAIATVTARLISGIYNFMMNRVWSFRSKHNIKHQFFKYATLYFAQLASSILLVSVFTLLFNKPVIIKAIIDGLLFFFSYQIQKHWVFHKKTI